jgi:hypothetical protein
MYTPSDRQILRDLAQQVAEIAALPIQAERRALWKAHNALQPGRPMLLFFPEGSWRELLPDGVLQCEDAGARGIEWNLRARLYGHAHFVDDTVVEGEWIVGKAIHHTDWGVTARRIAAPDTLGAWHFDPVILEPADLKKLKTPEVTYDEAATQAHLTAMQELFGDILDVRLKGIAHISYHLMSQYTALRGLEEVMIDMYAEPAMLHEAMELLTEGHQQVLKQYIALNLLSLNNDSTYHSSGGNGYTDELPRPDADPARVRPCDMWASAEAQELALVSPEMHDEFVLQYEKRLLAPFGLTGYGCCEDLTHKLADVLTLPQIRRVSISPFADVEACAAQLGDRAIFSWKPHPSHLVGDFDEHYVRNYIQHTVEAARAHGCILEMILKDTHTCESHPDRFDRWAQIAREVIDG